MKITSQLAQKIVENTMNVLGKNVNIMDNNGIIIGSGNRKRINDYHEGAAKVIRTGKTIFVKKSDNNIQGVKPGVNLPIKFSNNIIGVVGITGDIDEVGGYGEIVKNMVELILQREFLRREIEVENKARENFYQQLLTNSVKNKEVLKDRAKLFKINFKKDRVVMVIKVSPFNNKIVTDQIQTISSFLEMDKDNDMIFMRGNNIVLIKSFNKKEFKDQCNKIKNIADKLIKKLKQKFDFVKIGIGQIFTRLEKMQLSYQGAKHALKVGEKVYNKKNKNIFFLDHLGYDYFLPYIDQEAGEYYLHHVLENDILEIFENTNFGEIVEALVANNLNITKTAESLYMHRNTLLYKLDKIKNTTGMNPKDANNIFTLLLAYHLHLYQK
ncbi:MAG: CdaR family transcriptional regulator [Halothermotrichaceae bacterium]